MSTLDQAQTITDTAAKATPPRVRAASAKAEGVTAKCVPKATSSTPTSKKTPKNTDALHAPISATEIKNTAPKAEKKKTLDLNFSNSNTHATFMTPESRHTAIAQAAYFKAASRNFVGGDPVQDWLLSEQEIDASMHKY